MAEIYALYSARDGKVRHVGQTSSTRDARFKKHRQEAEGVWTVPMPPLVEWKCGYPINHALLQMCSDQIETEWINKFPNLLNIHKYDYRGGKPPIISEIKNYMRSYIFNCGGFRGIHYRRDIDRYAVFIYTGFGTTEWLDGTEQPTDLEMIFGSPI
jgi:hypothetical protein